MLRIKIPVEEEEIFVQFDRSVYQKLARDRLTAIFTGLDQTHLITEHTHNIPTIVDQRTYNAFVDTIPGERDIERRIKDEIRAAYAKIETDTKENERKRAEALAHPKLDKTDYFKDLTREVESTLRISIEDLGRKRDTLTQGQLESIAAQAVREKLDSPVINGSRVGDLVKITQMNGFGINNDGEMIQTYYHGGEQEDLPLGSEGEIVDIRGGDQYVVRFRAGEESKEWSVHPGEVKNTGRNVYREHLTTLGGKVEQVAKKVIQEASDRLTPRYTKIANDNTNRVFDGKRDEIAQSLIRKYRLNQEQMEALVAGKEFDYQRPEVQQVIDVGQTFSSLAQLVAKAFQGQTQKEVPAPNKVESEAKLRAYVLDTAQKLFGEEAFHTAKKVIDGISIIIDKEYDLVTKRPDKFNTERGALRVALNTILDRDFGPKLRRMLIYHDPDLFSSEPFSPPSEELNRVLKVEVGNGCNWGKCTYCTAYANERFFVRELGDFKEHALEVRKRLGDDLAYVERIFLAGGNIFMLSADKLIGYLDIVRDVFHNQRVNGGHYHGHRTDIRRVAAFGRTEGIVRKSAADLKRLHEHGLSMIYWGMETGADSVLKYVNKGTTAEQMLEAGEKLGRSDIWTSVMIMPGLGGIKYYADHVRETAKVLNKLKPRFITFLTTTIDPSCEYARIMAEEQARGENMPLTNEMIVEQIYDMVSLLHEGYHCLVAAYLPPRERVAVNPIEFQGRLQYNDGKQDILNTLRRYYGGERRPSPLIPATDFNRRSPIRALLKAA
jgi:hypothetical protein